LLNIEKKYKNLPWLEPQRAKFDELAAAGRCPHALLIHGRAGTGRRQLALWLAESLLGSDPSRPSGGDPESEAGHPDFIELLPEEGKASIGIDQVRALIGFFTLTSHSKAGRVAVVYPADSMTVQAANSLLKTLEEPPAGTVIVLISQSLARLPATIISRCQHIRVTPPAEAQALEWLEHYAPGAKLGPMLQFAGGSPLATLQLHEASFAEVASRFAADLRDLEQSRVSPVVVAERWKKQPDLALQWLYWHLSRRVHEGLGISEVKAPAHSGPADAVVQACFRQMSQIRELRRVINGGINAELNIAGLLMDWYGGFGDHR
jgi:DNA polymerase-3 subunit delta'